ncbi:hypothetical protein PIROE2DRAFT_57970 [Piromyces sp. E2]|nr:hypothetical protein PIROE2DRAFT_57970 [Piromyces sp. E2]|eukprot:OUM68655.1 hypothetical protein PIROE2DRAFT_57970 [Piromyces sp. E2]
MTLMNSCKTDSDCPPAWDKNAIFCSTPIYNQNNEIGNDEDDYLYKRDDDIENDVVVYDGSLVVEVDAENPESLSTSQYNPVCISYRPLGYPCKVRSDCLANDDVDLPYIQCVNSTCTDLGKTTGNYMKNAKGNHNKKSKYWYIGLGLGIITGVIVLGCIGLLLYAKKKKKEERKMEEKVKKANENDICDNEDEDNGTCVNDEYDYNNSFNKRFDHDEGSTVINSEVNYISKYHPEPEKAKYNNNSINKKNKKTKRSLLNILTFGLLGRHSPTIIDVENNNDNGDNNDTLGRPINNNKKKDFEVNEIDLSEGLKIKYNMNQDIKRNKSGHSIIKHGSTIDPERTLVRNLNKKNSKATVVSMISRSSTKNNVDINEMASVSSKNYPDVNELSSVSSTLYDNNTLKNRLYDTTRQSITSSVTGNFDMTSDEDDDYVSIKVNNNLNDKHYNSENYIDQENGINKAILKRLANQNEQLEQYNNNARIYRPSRSLSRKKSNKHPLTNNLSENIINNNNEISLENRISYPTPKQNPNSTIEMNNNQRVTSNTPISSTEHSSNNNNINNNNSNSNINGSSSYQGYGSSIYDYYQENSDDKKNDTKVPYILPQIQQPISEIVESTFGSNSSDESSVDRQIEMPKYLEAEKITKNIQYDDRTHTSNKYSIPTPYDSPREYSQQFYCNSNINDEIKVNHYNHTTNSISQQQQQQQQQPIHSIKQYIQSYKKDNQN